MTTPAPNERPPSRPPTRVAYMMSRFPKVTETFVLYEMKALEELGAEVELFPLQHQRRGPRHPEAVAYERRAHFEGFLSWNVIRANLRRLFREPRRYVSTWARALTGTWGSLNFSLGALVFFPKCVAFAERMEALGIDHIHAHFASHPALAAFVVHGLTGIPYSFTAHGSDLHVDRTMLPEKVADADFVVTVSGYNRELIVEECGEQARSKVAVIHCGADREVFDRAEDAEGSAERSAAHVQGTLRIACVASLVEVKGHRFLVEACRLLAERGIDVRVDLAGDGPLRPKLEKQVAEAGLSERITLHGAVPRPEVGRILREADVAVLVSCPTPSGKREGIPVALMEAMMSGLPVVASGLSGIPELVDHGRTGFLVPPGDPWSLADRLQEIAEQPELGRRFGTAGRDKVISEFDLEDGARALLEIIERPRGPRVPPGPEASRRPRAASAEPSRVGSAAGPPEPATVSRATGATHP